MISWESKQTCTTGVQLPPLPASPACLICLPPMHLDTILHFFTSCSKVSAAWHFLSFKATLTLGLALTNETLLFVKLN
jgi:hypothetical protein